MRYSKHLVAGLLGLSIVAGTALADGHEKGPEQQAMDARNAHMSLFGYNLGLLGAMAKGETPYDAASATAIANNLASLAKMDQSSYWIAGTDTSVEGSRALPAIWENIDDFIAKAGDLATASEAMVAAAGTDAAAIGAALGTVGGTCGACHKVYRAPQ